jgi:hypothetical protein
MKKMTFHNLGKKSSWFISTDLMTMPSVWKDMSRIFDMWGTLDEYNYSGSEEKADLKALNRDYLIIMHDLKDAQQSYERIRAAATT